MTELERTELAELLMEVGTTARHLSANPFLQADGLDEFLYQMSELLFAVRRVVVTIPVSDRTTLTPCRTPSTTHDIREDGHVPADKE